MDIAQFITERMANGQFPSLMRDPLAQFGTLNRQYLGATILPERPSDLNMFEDTSIRYRSIIANGATRYSPVQIKGGALVGSVDVKLRESDIGSEFTSRDYDAFRQMVQGGQDMPAMAAAINFVDTTLNRPLIEINELWRWQAIVEGVYHVRGDDNFREDVGMPQPTGHRPTVGGTWSSDAYDPMLDILAAVTTLTGKGYSMTNGRIICGTPVLNILLGNDKIVARGGLAVISNTGSVSQATQITDREGINRVFARYGLPALEIYDLTYATMTGTGHFLDRAAMVIMAGTDRQERVALTNNLETFDLLNGTIGYVPVGVAAGQNQPGRAVDLEVFTKKPPRIEGEAWQTSGVVINEPEAFVVLRGIA